MTIIDLLPLIDHRYRARSPDPASLRRWLESLGWCVVGADRWRRGLSCTTLRKAAFIEARTLVAQRLSDRGWHVRPGLRLGRACRLGNAPCTFATALRREPSVRVVEVA
jgi:hypothetical protein